MPLAVRTPFSPRRRRRAARVVPVALAAAVLVLAAAGGWASAAERWRWPVRGEVLTPFVVSANPFAPRQHRGIDIAAPAAARVRAACGGRVRFAGRLPGRGRGVSVVCGGLVATHLELGRLLVARGDHVAAGTPIGTVAASHVQLGARRLGRAHGYVDPLALLGAEPPPPLGPAPPPRRPPRHPPSLRRPVGAAPRAAPARVPIAAPEAPPARVAPPPAIPLAAWLGLGALAGATPFGALVARRRSRRASRRASVSRWAG